MSLVIGFFNRHRTHSAFAIPLLLLALFTFTGCVGNPSKTMLVKTWDMPAKGSEQPTKESKQKGYPELSEPEIYGVVRKRQKERQEQGDKNWEQLVGFAFSGGGTRSAAATLGQLRALHEIGWLSQADYISAVSGGSWTVVPYVYLPKGKSIDKKAFFQKCPADEEEGILTDQKFLGKYRKPTDLTDDHFKMCANGEMAKAIHTSSIPGRFLKNAVASRGDETYANSIGELFLKDFGLYDPVSARYFTWNSETRKAIYVQQDNKELERDNVEFVTVTRENRPYPIIGGTLISTDSKPRKSDLHLFEMTPIYSGVPVHADILADKWFCDGRKSVCGSKEKRDTYGVRDIDNPSSECKLKVRIGGGYVESFGYDTTFLEDEGGTEGLARVTHCEKKKYRFSLADMIGTSGAAPQETLLDFGLEDLGFPEHKHWPVFEHKGKTPQTIEYSHGDGGHVDNLGLMPLLARHVDKIVVFVNTARKFSPYPKGDGPQPNSGSPSQPIYDDVLSDDLVALFRLHDTFPFNVVFEDTDKDEDGNSRLSELYDGFKNAREKGAPLVYCDEYAVKKNDRYNITPYNPNICWVYLDLAKGWIDGLEKGAPEISDDIVRGKGDFEEFPHYKTFFHNGAKVIDLGREQVNALADLTSWSVIESAQGIRDCLDVDEERFPTPDDCLLTRERNLECSEKSGKKPLCQDLDVE